MSGGHQPEVAIISDMITPQMSIMGWGPSLRAVGPNLPNGRKSEVRSSLGWTVLLVLLGRMN